MPSTVGPAAHTRSSSESSTMASPSTSRPGEPQPARRAAERKTGSEQRKAVTILEGHAALPVPPLGARWPPGVPGRNGGYVRKIPGNQLIRPGPPRSSQRIHSLTSPLNMPAPTPGTGSIQRGRQSTCTLRAICMQSTRNLHALCAQSTGVPRSSCRARGRNCCRARWSARRPPRVRGERPRRR